MVRRWLIVVAAVAIGLWRPHSADAPVSVVLTAPVDGSVVSNTITLSATASTAAPNTSIVRVEFYMDGKLIGSVTNRPAEPRGVRVNP